MRAVETRAGGYRTASAKTLAEGAAGQRIVSMDAATWPRACAPSSIWPRRLSLGIARRRLDGCRTGGPSSTGTSRRSRRIGKGDRQRRSSTSKTLRPSCGSRWQTNWWPYRLKSSRCSYRSRYRVDTFLNRCNPRLSGKNRFHQKALHFRILVRAAIGDDNDAVVHVRCMP
jgi:hypothetical protein